jgi:hypothetical protein
MTTGTTMTRRRPSLVLLSIVLVVCSLAGLFIGNFAVGSQGDTDGGAFSEHSLVGVGIPFLVGWGAVLLLTVTWQSFRHRPDDRYLFWAAGIAFALVLELAAYLSFVGG